MTRPRDKRSCSDQCAAFIKLSKTAKAAKAAKAKAGIEVARTAKLALGEIVGGGVPVLPLVLLFNTILKVALYFPSVKP